MSNNERYRPLFPWAAGASAGVIEILITFPLEFLKTQTQLKTSNQQSTGIRTLVQTTWENKGFLGFYKGLTPWLVFAIPRNVVRFSVYDEVSAILLNDQAANFPCKDIKHHIVNINHDVIVDNNETTTTLSPGRGFFAGLVAGMVEAITVLTPMHAIQIKMIHDASRAQNSGELLYQNFWQALIRIPKREGIIQGLWCGCGATTLKAGTTNAIRFSVFESLANQLKVSQNRQKLDIKKNIIFSTNRIISPKNLIRLYSIHNYLINHDEDASESMICGGVAGAMSVLVSHPIDTVKSHMQSLEAHLKYQGNFDCARKLMLSQQGPGCLFNGVSVRFVRVSLEVALLFTLYDQFGRIIDNAVVGTKDSKVQ